MTNSELMFAFGADMVMLNTINLDDVTDNPGFCGMSYQELKALCRRPIGVYLGCPGAGTQAEKTYAAQIEAQKKAAAAKAAQEAAARAAAAMST